MIERLSYRNCCIAILSERERESRRENAGERTRVQRAASKKTSVSNASPIGYFIQIQHNREDKRVYWPEVPHIPIKQCNSTRP